MIKSNTSTFGHFMYFLFWILILAIMVFFFDRYLSHRNNPNQDVETVYNNQVKTVRLQRNRQGQYRVTGKINNVKVNMLIDTGATSVSIPAPLANKLRLSKGHSIIGITANGETVGNLTQLHQVEVGDISVSNVRAVILPNMKGDVLLGMSFLRYLNFSQQGRSLTLTQSTQ